jgi:hypothetical protein
MDENRALPERAGKSWKLGILRLVLPFWVAENLLFVGHNLLSVLRPMKKNRSG